MTYWQELARDILRAKGCNTEFDEACETLGDMYLFSVFEGLIDPTLFHQRDALQKLHNQALEFSERWQEEPFDG